MTQSLLRAYFNKYQVLDDENIIEEQLLKHHQMIRKIGNPIYIQILNIMLEDPGYDFTINEVAQILGMERSTISARMHELRCMGLLIYSQTRMSRVTCKTNDAYKPVDNLMECVEFVD